MNDKRIVKAIFKKIVQATEIAFGFKIKVDLPLETPPNPAWGDFAVPVFLLAKELRKNPATISQKIATTIEADENILSAEAKGPYVNFKLTEKFFREAVLAQKKPAKSQENIMIEYLSPNTNKPLHLGHMRNGVLGSAMANILQYMGHKVTKAMLVNDRGIHICKSMLAWQKFGNGETPKSSGLKGDHLVGKYYVRFADEAKNNPNLIKEAQAMLQKWEAGDHEIIELWTKMNDWVYEGFNKTFQQVGFKFDVMIYESQIYQQGRKIVEDGLKKGIFKKDKKGAVIFELPKKEFGLNEEESIKKVTVLRADGTSVYITQDLALALKKAQEYNLTRSIYVIGDEQDDYFKRLFTILKALGYEWADKSYCLSYAMVELTTGKMKSREGTVVDVDDLIIKMKNLAKKEIIKRINNNDLSKREIAERAMKIGLGAIKFFLLKNNPKQKIIFDPKESISFDGVTGAYCQYVYARANSVLKKAKKAIKEQKEVDFSLLGKGSEERVLARKLLLFEDNFKKAAKEYNPSFIANAVYDLAQAFNHWYNSCRVVDENNLALSNARLTMVTATMSKIKKGLELLGIETLEEM